MAGWTGRRGLARIAGGALVATWLTAAAAGCGGDPARDAPPNVLLIISDDQRDNTLDGMPQASEWLGEGGREMTRAVVTTPVCCPSRASIFSGLYTHNHRVAGSEHVKRFDESRAMAAALQAAGYRTGLYGKYLNEWPKGKPPGGFDEHHVGYGRAGGYGGGGPGRERADDWLAQRATGFIERGESDDERPWLLVLAARSPHNPLKPARRYEKAKVPPFRPADSLSELDMRDKPAAVRRMAAQTRRKLDGRGGLERAVARIRKAQLRLLLSLDDMVGATRRALEDAGEDEETLVIYLSDNGFFWGEHGLIQKGRAYPETLEVPMLVRWPGRVEPGPDDRIAANIDIAPTIYDAAGVDPGYEPDGRSLLGDYRREWILTERRFEDEDTRGAFVPGREQYLEARNGEGEVVSREYYDLVRDPSELDNLVGAQGEPRRRVERWRRAVARASECAGASCP